MEPLLAGEGALRGAEITSNIANSLRLVAAGSGKMPLSNVIGCLSSQLSVF